MSFQSSMGVYYLWYHSVAGYSVRVKCEGEGVGLTLYPGN